MHRKLSVLLVALVMLLVAACGQSGDVETVTVERETTGGGETTATEYPVTVEGDLGRKVEIDGEPERLASVAPSITETVFAVGAGEKLVGVSEAADYPEEARDIEAVGDYQQVNAEKVASLEVDVLLLSFDSTTVEKARDLERKTGAKVVVVNPKSVRETIDSMSLVGKAVGNPEEGRELEEQMQDDLEQIRGKVEGLEKPTVFYELGYDPLFTVGPGGLISSEIKLAGGENVAADAQKDYLQYPVEKLLQANPEYYLIDSATGVKVEDVRSRSRFSSLGAVKEDRVVVVNSDLVARPGPRVVEGVREIASAIHPEAFEE